MDVDRSLRPFAHLGTEKAQAYRAVLEVFAVARARFTVHLRPEDVAAGLDQAPADLKDLLDSLTGWGNLRADPDTSRVTTVEDFHRARYLYSLSREGEAVEVAVRAYGEALGRRGELQAVALSDIRDQLRALAEVDVGDEAKVHAGLLLLTERFRGLADNALVFMASVQRTVDLAEVDVDGFLAYKDRLIDYLQRFVRDLVVAGGDIADLLDDLDPRLEGLFRAAGSREARDAAPAPDGLLSGPAQDTVSERAEQWRQRWTGLRHWFVGDRARPSQSALLRDRARGAIPALLSTAATLHERRTGVSDRSADFRQLARWFAEADDEPSCHRLWRAAFGLSPARHLTVDPDTLTAREHDPVPATTSWADAPPVVIHPRLRRTGHAERRGRPVAVADRSQQRRHLAGLAAAEAGQTEAARQRLATGRPTRLSDLPHLDPAEFSLFLSLLSEALSAQAPGAASVETTTADGSLLVRMVPTRDGVTAEIRTGAGVLRGPDHVLTVLDADAEPQEQAS